MGGSWSLWLPVPALCRGFLPPLGGARQEAAGLRSSSVSRGSLVGRGKFRRGWMQSVRLACWWESAVTDMAGCGALFPNAGAGPLVSAAVFSEVGLRIQGVLELRLASGVQ